MSIESLNDFRTETRAWLEENCPPEMRAPTVEAERCFGGSKMVFHSHAQRLWLSRMAERGWTAPDWPREYGGGGLAPAQVHVLREEMNRLSCRPPLERVGPALGMLGPTLLKYGTEEQKHQHLPAIASGAARWCQGYSEPNAGSDLVSLQTRAELRGDRFVVNGQKIWTSAADKSDWIFVLVRTDPHAARHNGITLLLADMSSPGIECRPITLLSGRSQFCEVFFTNVEVPLANLVGEMHRGWPIAKYLLTHERTEVGTAKSLVAGPALGTLAASLASDDAEGRLTDTALRAQIAAWEVDAWSFTFAAQRNAELTAAGQTNPAEASTLKYLYSELNQRRYELLMSAGGSALLEWESARSQGGEVARAWLRSKANSIEGGTTEIQLNILAKRVLELPGA